MNRALRLLGLLLAAFVLWLLLPTATASAAPVSAGTTVVTQDLAPGDTLTENSTDESTEDGARREALEEAGARIDITGLLGVYNVVRLGQVQLFYGARLLDPDVVAGPETLELYLFEWGAIPWDQLAFPSVHWVLRRALEIKDVAGPYLPALGP